jgi:hypothetical protein
MLNPDFAAPASTANTLLPFVLAFNPISRTADFILIFAQVSY